MAIKIVKNSVNQPSSPQQRTASKSSAKRSPSEYRQQQQRYQQTSSGGGAGKVITIVIIVLIFFGIVLVASVSGNNKRRQTAQYQPQPVQKSTQTKDGLERYDSLGGLTMGEWEKMHNKDNAALKARKSRMRNPKNYK